MKRLRRVLPTVGGQQDLPAGGQQGLMAGGHFATPSGKGRTARGRGIRRSARGDVLWSAERYPPR